MLEAPSPRSLASANTNNQILLASNRGKNAYHFAHELGCKPHATPSALSTRKDSRKHFSQLRSIRRDFFRIRANAWNAMVQQRVQALTRLHKVDKRGSKS